MRNQANSQKVRNKQNSPKLVTEQKVKGLKEYQTIRRPLTSRGKTLTKISQIIKYYPQRYHIKRIAQDLPSKRDQSTMRTKEHKKTRITIAGDSLLNYTEGQKLLNRTRTTKVRSFPGPLMICWTS